MIDPQRFVRGNKIDPAALEEVAVRRLKRDLKEAKGVRRPTGQPASLHADSQRVGGVRPTPRLHSATGQGSCCRRRKPVGQRHGDPAVEEAILLVAGRVRPDGRRLPRHALPVVSTSTSTSTTTRSSAPTPTSLRKARSTSPSLRPCARPRSALPALTEEDSEDLEWLSDWGHRFEGRPDSRLEALLDLHRGHAPLSRRLEQRAPRHLHRVRRHLALAPRHPAPAGLRG